MGWSSDMGKSGRITGSGVPRAGNVRVEVGGQKQGQYGSGGGYLVPEGPAKPLNFTQGRDLDWRSLEVSECV